MSRNKEVNTLMNKLLATAETGNRVEFRFDHYLLPDIDVASYKRAKAYPGKEYMLMGNSFNLEPENVSEKREVALAGCFARSKKGGCLTVSEALSSDDFNQVLSRFERDWLHRMAEDTLLGPAYDDRGRLLGSAFAVWRPLKKVLQTCVVG